MNIGKLDRRITIQAKTTTRDASEGGTVDTWADVVTVWAEKLDVGGSKGFRGGALRPETDTVFTIRHRSDVTALHRITYQGAIYGIVSVAEIGRREGLTIQTKTEDVHT